RIPSPLFELCQDGSVLDNVQSNPYTSTIAAERFTRTEERHLQQEPCLMSKYVYFFGSGKAEGRADMKELLGGKGANLAEMTNIGLPVPAGFTLTTEICTYYYAHD